MPFSAIEKAYQARKEHSDNVLILTFHIHKIPLWYFVNLKQKGSIRKQKKIFNMIMKKVKSDSCETDRSLYQQSILCVVFSNVFDK